MCESTPANRRTGVSFARGRSLGKNTSIIICASTPVTRHIAAMSATNRSRERYVRRFIYLLVLSPLTVIGRKISKFLNV